MESGVKDNRGFFRRMLRDPDVRRADLFFASGAPHVDYLLLAVIAILVLLGSLMVFSASFAYAEYRYGDSYYFIGRQIIWVIVSGAVMFCAAKLTPVLYRHLAVPLYGIVIALLLAVLVIGSIGNGAQRWISLGPITIQPSEIAKTSLVLILARYYSVFEERALEIRSKPVF